MLRSFGGDEDHPTITKFSQLYRLLSLYTPVKAATKGNCSGGHDAVLVSLDNSFRQKRRHQSGQKAQIEKKNCSSLLEACSGNASDPQVDLDHVYSSPTVEDSATYYLCGYVVRKCRKMTTCTECIDDITGGENLPPEATFTIAKSYTPQSLLHPSIRMFNCFKVIEHAIHKELDKKVFGDMFWHVLDVICESSIEPLGCKEHCHEFTVRIVKFYLVTRMHFHSRAVTKNLAVSEKAKHARKKTKLLWRLLHEALLTTKHCIFVYFVHIPLYVMHVGYTWRSFIKTCCCLMSRTFVMRTYYMQRDLRMLSSRVDKYAVL